MCRLSWMCGRSGDTSIVHCNACTIKRVTDSEDPNIDLLFVVTDTNSKVLAVIEKESE